MLGWVSKFIIGYEQKKLAPKGLDLRRAGA